MSTKSKLSFSALNIKRKRSWITKDQEQTSIKEKKEKVILIGNPNVGKSLIFQHLTGTYVTISNFPGTTVEITTGNASFNGKTTLVIDTPGVTIRMPFLALSAQERIPSGLYPVP